jgi:hypothetical protein
MLAKSQTHQALPRAGDPGSAATNPPIPPLFISIDEACQLLGVSRPWGYLHLFGPSGEVIPTVSLEGGRRRLVPYAALVAYANDQMAAAGVEVAEPPGVASGRRGR